MQLRIENLTCIRGGRVLFESLNFTAASGEALVVTGPNGAGKSSLLRLIAGLLRATAGRIMLEGSEADRPVREAAHFVGHLDGVKGALSVEENLAFASALLGSADHVDTALTRLGLVRLASLPARMLSAGQRRRLALARLLVAPRPLWLLDEPTSALDAEGQEALSGLMAEHLAGGGLLAVATHAPLALPHARKIHLGGGSA